MVHYQQFAAEGLPIGSGVLDAACKTLVTRRMKQSGIRWKEKGGQAIVDRARLDAERHCFNRAWAPLAVTHQAEAMTLHNVVPRPPADRSRGR